MKERERTRTKDISACKYLKKFMMADTFRLILYDENKLQHLINSKLV